MSIRRSKFGHGGPRKHAGRRVTTLGGFLKGLSAEDAERARREIRGMAWREILQMVEGVIAGLERTDQAKAHDG